MISYAKKMQPISTTGMFTHTYYWITSPTGDLIYQNPYHKSNLNQNSDTAIYLIHGTADQPAAFQRIAEGLIKNGLPGEISNLNLVSFDQRYLGRSIESFAEQLIEKIKKNSHHRVIFIAHSRGGLVVSYMAEFLAKLAGIEVPLIITIGTPFNGSYLAINPLSWFSNSVKEMEIGSDFLMQLKKKIVESSESHYHFFIAQEDAIVPGESGYIKEYVNKYPNSLNILDRHGHLSVMSSHRLMSFIATLLDTYFNPTPNCAEKKTASKLSEFNVIEDYFATELNNHDF